MFSHARIPPKNVSSRGLLAFLIVSLCFHSYGQQRGPTYFQTRSESPDDKYWNDANVHLKRVGESETVYAWQNAHQAAPSTWSIDGGQATITANGDGASATLTATNASPHDNGTVVKSVSKTYPNPSDTEAFTYVAVTALIATPDVVLLHASNVVYTIVTQPADHTNLVTYTPADTSTPGIKQVIASCGSSAATCTVTVLKVELDLKTAGPLSAGNNLASDPDIVARFGTSCSLGGPVIVNNAAVDPTAANTVGHLVEIKGTPTPAPSAGGPTISRYSFTQKLTKYTTTVRFSDSFQLGPSSALVNVPDDPEIVQNNSGDHFFTLDAPGPGSDAMFSYFGPTPPPITGQPPGTTVTAIIFRVDLSTQGTFDGSPCGEVLSWFVEYNIHGPAISDVNSTAGEVAP